MAIYEFSGLRFDASEGRLEKVGSDVQARLRPQVARLLGAFLQRPQTLIARDALCGAVWDEGTVIDFESGLAAVLRELRAELKALGAPDDLIETLPRRGYRLRATVERRELTSGWSPAGRKRLIGLSAALLLLIVAAILAWPEPQETRSPGSDGWVLAVIPFSQFGAPAQGPAQLDLLLADLLLVQLWEQRPADLNLLGRASLIPYAGRDNVAAAVARDLGVNLLIEGSVMFDRDMMSVSARLLEMPGGRIVWSETLNYHAEAAPGAAEIAAQLSESMISAWSAQTP